MCHVHVISRHKEVVINVDTTYWGAILASWSLRILFVTKYCGTNLSVQKPLRIISKVWSSCVPMDSLFTILSVMDYAACFNPSDSIRYKYASSSDNDYKTLSHKETRYESHTRTTCNLQNDYTYR